MPRLRRLWGRVSRRAAAIDREVRDEIRFHLEMREQLSLEAGMSAREAKRDARRRFGDPERVRRAGRELLAGAPPTRDGARPLQALLQDVRFGVRMLRRNPLTTFVAVASLALGIGANTANFSVVYGILHRALPFVDGERIVHVESWNPDRGDGDAGLTWGDLGDLRDSGAFDVVEAMTQRNFTVTASDHPERIAGAAVTPGLFGMLGVDPALGRGFGPNDAAAAGFESTVLISDALWRRSFAADPEVVGRTLHLNGRELVIVGVMPPGFSFPETQELWVALGTEDPTDRRFRAVRAVAKLRPDVSLAAMAPRFEAAAERAEQAYPETHRGFSLRVQPFREGFIDARGRQSLYLMFAAVAFVLLLACANVANLLLAHAGERRRELVVRSALGATRFRLARQMITESVILGLAGAVVGLFLAQLWVGLFIRAIPEQPAFWIQVAVDRAAATYAVLVAGGTGILFGLLPAWQASRGQMDTALRSGGRSGDRGGRLRASLVVAEVALAVVLLISATLMMRSFLAMQSADPGFDPGRLLSARVVLSGDQYDEPAARAVFFRNAARRLGSMPGAVAAAATGAIPADDGGADVQLRAAAGPRADDEPFYATAVPSTSGLFDALGIELLAGRDFTDSEVADPDARVAIVGASLARVLWPGEEALGRDVEMRDLDTTFRIVGVAPDLQYEEFGEDTRAARLQLHVPYVTIAWRGMAFLVRAQGEPGTLLDGLRAELAAIDEGQALYDLLTLDDRRALTTWPQRLFGSSFGAFGALALVLALCGVYAVVAYSVSRRTREMGVRIALGARPRDVRASVVRSATRMALIGVTLGLGLGWLFSRGMSGVLYGVEPGDPTVFAGAGALLILVAIVASWLPARRAARVDPIEALRAD